MGKGQKMRRAKKPEELALQALQAQCDVKKWLESERAEKDMSGQMDFCEGCLHRVKGDCEYKRKPYEKERSTRCLCAHNYRRLEDDKRSYRGR